MKKRILIVDDEREACTALVDILKDNYDVMCAYDGEEALRAIEEVRPHLIIMDYDMPVLDGIAATEYILMNPENRSIKFILLSAYLHGKRVQDWIALIDNPVVFNKPCDIDELEAAVQALLA